MSSKTGAHDIVGVSREVKMESSAGEGGSISKAVRGLFFEEWDKTEGIWIDLISLAQLFRRSFDDSSDSRTEGISSSSFCIFL